MLGHIAKNATLPLSHFEIVDMIVGLVKEVVRVIEINQFKCFFKELVQFLNKLGTVSAITFSKVIFKT